MSELMRTRVLTVVCILTMSWLLGLTVPAWAACSGSSPNRTAPTWADVALCYTAAVAGDTITVAAGTFTPTASTDLTDTTKHVTIKGAGTMPLQGAATSGGTTLVVNVAAGSIISAVEATTGNVTIANLTFTITSAAQGTNFGAITFGDPCVGCTTYPANNKQAVIHHITFNATDRASNQYWIYDATGRAVIYRNYFTGNPIERSMPMMTCARTGATVAQWTTVALYGAQDTNGNQKGYFETNKAEYYSDTGTDIADSCQYAIRYNDFTNYKGSNHGYDSSPVGARLIEWYNNHFVCDVARNTNVSQWIVQRGGTAIYTDNIFDAIPANTCGNGSVAGVAVVGWIHRLQTAGVYSASACWPFDPVTSITNTGTTAHITFSVPHGLSTGQHISVYVTGPAPYNGLFNVTVTGTTTADYTMASDPGGPATGSVREANSQAHSTFAGANPVSRQIGWGWKGGGTTTYEGDKQDLEPTYFFNNTNNTAGDIVASDPGFTDACQNGLTTGQFFRSGTEYLLRAPQAGDPVITSYTKYQYPHPLATIVSGGGGGPSGGGGGVGRLGNTLPKQ